MSDAGASGELDSKEYLIARQKSSYSTGGCNTTKNLSNEDEQRSQWRDNSNDAQGEGDLTLGLAFTIIISASPKLTAGLNSPPLILKKTQTLIAKLKPNTSAIYNSWVSCGPWPFGLGFVCKAAVCVPPNAKKRKRKVPTNSPRKATR